MSSYIGLQLSVRSEYNIAGTFTRNIFFVEGMTGLKYRCGTSGSLPQGFVESSYYTERTLENIPNVIERKQKDIARLVSELPTLHEIVSRQWNKTAEIEALKKEGTDMQRRIDESLKAVGNGETPEQPKHQMPDEIAA